MSAMVDDIFGGFQTLFRLIIEFVNGREKLKKLKLRDKKHLIGMVFPSPELIFASGGIPVFPIRMHKFDLPMIKLIDNTRKLTGWSFITKTFNILNKFEKNKQFFTRLLDEMIEKTFFEYNRVNDLGEEMGVPADSCFGVRTITGMLAEKGKNLSANFNMNLRCSTWEKFLESTHKFVKRGLWVDVPLRKTTAGMEMLIDSLYKVSENLEELTGIPITNTSFRDVCESTNECKDYSLKIIHDIALGEVYPCNPVTLSEFLSLIEITFQDFISNHELFKEILKNMYSEMEQRKRSEFAIDVSNMPKILFLPRFGGWDPISHEYIYENGGRTIYADWEILGYLSKIKTTGDMFENYANFLMDTITATGVLNEDHINRITDFVKKNDIDAVVYNVLFGCRSLTSGYRDLRKKLIRSDIPSTMVSFNKIGENRGQLKTRIEALLEMI